MKPWERIFFALWIGCIAASIYLQDQRLIVWGLAFSFVPVLIGIKAFIFFRPLRPCKEHPLFPAETCIDGACCLQGAMEKNGLGYEGSTISKDGMGVHAFKRRPKESSNVHPIRPGVGKQK